MKEFGQDQRVKVGKTTDGVVVNILGTVKRIRVADGGAWITLDKRGPGTAHPFDDEGRRNDVMAWPEDCEPAVNDPVGNRKSRRRNKKIAAEPAVVSVAMFGKDHWSTFGYLTTLGIDGEPRKVSMRCNTGRHPQHAGSNGNGAGYPTRLKGGAELADHDDWDCVDDLIGAGFIENVGSRVNPRYAFTPLGHDVARQLADHKRRGGNFATFDPILDASLKHAQVNGLIRAPEQCP